MKAVYSLVASLAVAGCGVPGGLGTGVPGNWSSSGLTYNAYTGQFTGVPETAPGMMPTTGSAQYSGEYRYTTVTTPFGKGPAQLSVDFPTSNVALSVSGLVSGTSTGNVYANAFISDGTGFPFSGMFYGTGAGLAAGNFVLVGGGQGAGQFIVKK